MKPQIYLEEIHANHEHFGLINLLSRLEIISFYFQGQPILAVKVVT